MTLTTAVLPWLQWALGLQGVLYCPLPSDAVVNKVKYNGRGVTFCSVILDNTGLGLMKSAQWHYAYQLRFILEAHAK